MSSRFFAANALLTLCLAAPAAAQVPHLMGYQGRLLRADGTAATGTAGVSFSVWDSATGGSRLWNETQTLGLSDGYYATFLGLATTTPDGLFDGPARWVEIQVGGETLAPRQQAGAVPYAVTAQSVVGSVSATSLRVGGQAVFGSDGRLAGPARYTAGAGIAIDASQTISLPACADGQMLARDATGWACATRNAGTVTSVGAAAPLSVTDGATTPQLSIAQAGASSGGFLSSVDWNAFNAKYGTGTQCGGDLSGPMATPTVVRLQSRAVSAAAPGAGQVLKWSAGSTQWEPSADVFTNVTAIAPLTAQGSGSTSVQLSMLQAGHEQDGYLATADWAAFDAKAEKVCGGDLSGSLPSPTVVALQSRAVADDEPQPGQVLYWDATAWRPETLAISDVTGLSSGYLALTGDQTISGAKTFTTPLGVASGGTGSATAGEHTVFAGPLSGTGAPAFRTLDATDIQTGTLGVARGGTGVSGTFTKGSVVFAGDGGGYSQDNARLFWDADNGRLGVGTNTPGAKLAVGGIGGANFGDDTSAGLLVSSAGHNRATLASSSTEGHQVAYELKAGSDTAAMQMTQGIGTLRFQTGGADRVAITSGGSVGIGTLSPVSRFEVGPDLSPTNPVALRGAWPAVYYLDTEENQDSFLTFVDGNSFHLALNPYASRESPQIGSILMSVRSDGRVGIGTGSPGYRLDVAGAGSTLARLSGGAGQGAGLTMGSSGNAQWLLGPGMNDLSNADDFGIGSGGTNKLVVRADGNVGIGTTAPAATLEVTSGNNAPAGGISIDGRSNEPSLVLRQTGALKTYLSVGPGTLSGVAGDTTVLRAEGAFELGTGGNNRRLAVTSGGKVGIGTAAPDANLHVAVADHNATALTTANAAGFAGLRLESNGASTCPGEVLFGDMAGANWFWMQAGKIDRGCVSNSGNLLAGYTLSLNPLGGNVGIGTTSAAYTLDVAGSARVTGTLTATLSGNASTASALAANGANAPFGAVAPGVDAQGAAEGSDGQLWGASSWTQSGLISWSAASVNDGSTSSAGFHTDSSPDGSWLQLDTGGSRAFTRLAVFSGRGPQANYSKWDVQYSDDASTWRTTYQGLDLTHNYGGWVQVGWRMDNDATPYHRYWRLYQTYHSPGDYVKEVQFYESASVQGPNYIVLNVNGDQSNPGSGAVMPFTSVVASRGLVQSGNGVALKAGHTYRMEAVLNTYLGNTGCSYCYLGYMFKETAGGNQVGGTAYTATGFGNARNYGFHSGLLYFYRPAVDTVVTIVIMDGALGASNNYVTNSWGTYFAVTEM